MNKKPQKVDFAFPFIHYGRHLTANLCIALLGIIFILMIASFFFFQDSVGSRIAFGLLNLLAIIGIFFLVLLATGSIEITLKSHCHPLAKVFMDTEPEGVLITTKRGHVIYANFAYNQLTNVVWNKKIRPLETLLSRNRESIEVLYRLINNLRKKKEGQGEFRLMHSLRSSQNSEPHWYRLKTRILPAPLHKEKFLYAWRLTDITSERKDQERFFKDLQSAIDYLDHAPIGFMSADHQGKIIYINATLAEWLGIDLTKFTSKSISIGDIIAGEGLSVIQAVQAKPGLQKTVTLYLDLRRIDNGHGIPVKLIHHVISAYEGNNGESRTVVITRENCDTDDKSGTIATMRFNRFFNNAPMAIASIDKKGGILRTNGLFLKLFSGILKTNDTSKSIFSIVHENERQKLITALDDVNDQKSDIAPIDSRHPTDDNRYFHFYINAALDHSTESPDERAIVYAIETTEQKALEARMMQTQKLNAVGTLAGGIAHDFNNVLTAILLSADHLLLQSRSSDASFADLMEIKNNANRAAILVRQLLAFSRKQTMRPTTLNLTEVISNLRMMIQKLISEPPYVELCIDYERNLWNVKTDLSQFEQVLVNLCVNARHAMPNGGCLTLRTRNIPAKAIDSFNCTDLPKKDMVLVEVEDIGIGMSPDVMEKIFEPFFTTKEIGKGTGLGLSVVYGVIRQSGGYIFPESEVGKGTIFRIFLPRHLEEIIQNSSYYQEEPSEETNTALPPIKQQTEPADLTGNSAIVLLVEDENAVRRGSKRMLEARGYTVHEACSGISALEIIDELQGQIDVVISDVVMPEMDGPTLLCELRKNYPNLKFIFISGYAEDAFSRNLPKDAKFSFLPKPFSLKQLATSVHEVLQSDS